MELDNMGFELSSVFEKLQMLSISDDALGVSINQFVALVCFWIMIGYLIEENPRMNEAINALCTGLCTGVVILLVSGGKISDFLVFSEDLFFICLLPTIIFNAGFQVKMEQFFNLITIMLLVILIFCGIIIFGLIQIFRRVGISPPGDYLAIGAIFAAFFGIALRFFGNFLYLFLTSTSLGILTGLLGAYIIKRLYIGRHSTDRQFALMMLMAYLSYMLAELCYLSGILSVFFCGFVMSHYTWHNVTEGSRTNTKHTFATLSFVAETFIFLYVGKDALDIETWLVSDSPGTSVAVISVLLGLVLVGRATSIFPISFLSNLAKKSPNEKISLRQQVIIGWAGLMRVVLSMALACNQFTLSGHTQLRSNAIMITGLITVVLFCTVVYGLLTSHPRHNQPRHNQRDARCNDSQISHRHLLMAIFIVPVVPGSHTKRNGYHQGQ